MSESWADKMPRDRTGNEARRAKLAAAAETSEKMRGRLVEACRNEPLYWLSAFAWTFDPRRADGDRILPFIAYPCQERAFLKLLHSIRSQKPLVIEKSRDMGATWLCLYAFLYLAQFHKGYSFLVLSKKGDAVSKERDTDSLFWKLLFAAERQPAWLVPEMDRVRGHIGFKANTSSIDAETSVEAAGVGGRRSAILFDEFARFPDADAVYKGTIDTARCRIFNFTPWGTGNKAYELSKMVAEGKIDGLRLHWSEHPEKSAGLYRWPVRQQLEIHDPAYEFPADYEYVRDGKLRSPWYDAYCRELRDDRGVAENLDIDYLASKHQFYSNDTVRELIAEYAREPVWTGDVSRGELVTADNGPMQLWRNPVPSAESASNLAVPFGRYAIGADIGHGVGATPSCLSIVDMETGEKVGAYVTSSLDPQAFADVAMMLGRMFRQGPDEYGQAGTPAKLIWELQGPGTVFAKRIVLCSYGPVYVDRKDGRVGEREGELPGWMPTQAAKLTLHSDYRAALYTRQFLNRCSMAMMECLRYTFHTDGTIDYDGSRASADPTGGRQNHGDRVVADALAWKLIADAHLARPMAAEAKPDDPRVNPPVLSLAWRRKMAEAETAIEWL